MDQRLPARMGGKEQGKGRKGRRYSKYQKKKHAVLHLFLSSIAILSEDRMNDFTHTGGLTAIAFGKHSNSLNNFLMSLVNSKTKSST